MKLPPSDPSTAQRQTDPPRETAGVVAPPPLLILPALLLSEAMRWFYPLAFADGGQEWRLLIAAALATASIALAATAMLGMRRVRTPVEPWKPTRSIVSTGAYAISRNPIYVAFLGLQLAYAWGMANAWGVLLLPLSIGLLHWGVIAREERYLARRFGDEYVHYKQRVRRWL